MDAADLTFQLDILRSSCSKITFYITRGLHLITREKKEKEKGEEVGPAGLPRRRKYCSASGLVQRFIRSHPPHPHGIAIGGLRPFGGLEMLCAHNEEDGGEASDDQLLLQVEEAPDVVHGASSS